MFKKEGYFGIVDDQTKEKGSTKQQREKKTELVRRRINGGFEASGEEESLDVSSPHCAAENKETQSAAVIGGATATGGVGMVAVMALAVVFVKYRILCLMMMNRNKVRDIYTGTAQDEQMNSGNAYIQDGDTVEGNAESQNA
ncbi:hypothetical protein AWC38_SpisGene7570 [Stylophora pistillata]|uniref:Uncharacterized protein n=1 Tax=Stylophora pistillata TaxID=50429 RepID=A0A2B4SGN5_STYPI|nr:hypothetical protein AWC38_SpisGene7570 [Stylophora pistillata]